MVTIRALTLLRQTVLVAGALIGGACGASERTVEAQAEESTGSPHRASVARAWTPAPFDGEVASHWRDGKAELASYEIIHPRYGQLRPGTAVAIVVHEGTLDPHTMMKNDGPAPNGIPALKLNLAMDFPTGVYDYHQMTSVFAATGDRSGYRAGDALKVSYSAQEWCGHVYSQVVFSPDAVQLTGHSYFEGEADVDEATPRPADALAEDALWLWARGLAGPAVDEGEEVTIPVFRSLAWTRLRHVPAAFDTAVLSRDVGTEERSVPAGTFRVARYRAVVAARRWTFEVEASMPHRVIRFERDDGLEGTLVGSQRLDYWNRHNNGDERWLEPLGLEPRPPRTP